MAAPGLNSNAALDAGASQPATLIKPGVEPCHGQVAERLDEALRYAVARIEDDPQNVDAIIRHLGWDGRYTRDEDVGEPPGLPPERVKQIVVRAIDRMREDGFIPRVVEQSIILAERSVPILDIELCNALLNAKLCFIKFACAGLALAAAIFREKSPFEVARLGQSDALVKAGTTEGINRLAARARAVMRSRGCASMMELTDYARELFGPNASQGFTEAAVRTVARFEWLDQQNGWFWYMPDNDPGANRLVDQIKRVLATAPRVRLTELRSAIRRDHRFGSFAPPLKVLASICKRLLFLHLDGDAVVRVPGLVPWDAVLGPNETTLADVLQTHGPVMGREEFLGRCRERGMQEDTFNQFTACSAIVKMPVPGMYALVGAAIPAGTIENNGAAATEAGSASASHGVLSEGRVFLAWKLQSSTLQSGVLRVPEPASTFVEGDYNLETVTNRELGVIQICQRACWDVRRLLRDAGGEADDNLVIVLSLHDRRAIGILGDETVIARVMSGEAGLHSATPDADRQAEEHGEFGPA
jgi:hypothetical protein